MSPDAKFVDGLRNELTLFFTIKNVNFADMAKGCLLLSTTYTVYRRIRSKMARPFRKRSPYMMF